MNIEVKIKPGKADEIQYIDYIHFIGKDSEEADVSPTHSSYDRGTVYMKGIELNGDDTNGRIKQLLDKSISEIQFCDKDGEELFIEGNEVLDYVEKLILYDSGEYFEYCPDDRKIREGADTGEYDMER